MSRLEAELVAMSAIEELVVAAASDDPSEATKVESKWQRYLKLKALALGAGATPGEATAARRKALGGALELALALLATVPTTNGGPS